MSFISCPIFSPIVTRNKVPSNSTPRLRLKNEEFSWCVSVPVSWQGRGKEPTGKQLVSHYSCIKERTVLLLLCHTCAYRIHFCRHKMSLSMFVPVHLHLLKNSSVKSSRWFIIVRLPLSHTCPYALPHHGATNTTVQTQHNSSHHSPKGSEHEEKDSSWYIHDENSYLRRRDILGGLLTLTGLNRCSVSVSLLAPLSWNTESKSTQQRNKHFWSFMSKGKVFICQNGTMTLILMLKLKFF